MKQDLEIEFFRLSILLKLHIIIEEKHTIGEIPQCSFYPFFCQSFVITQEPCFFGGALCVFSH